MESKIGKRENFWKTLTFMANREENIVLTQICELRF